MLGELFQAYCLAGPEGPVCSFCNQGLFKMVTELQSSDLFIEKAIGTIPCVRFSNGSCKNKITENPGTMSCYLKVIDSISFVEIGFSNGLPVSGLII